MKRYQIELYGYVDHSWGDWFKTADLCHLPDARTRMIFELPDQSALLGLLLRLHGLGLELLSLERLPAE